MCHAQLEALQAGDAAGVFRFASPANQAATGPVERFAQMLQASVPVLILVLEGCCWTARGVLGKTGCRQARRILLAAMGANLCGIPWAGLAF